MSWAIRCAIPCTRSPGACCWPAAGVHPGVLHPGRWHCSRIVIPKRSTPRLHHPVKRAAKSKPTVRTPSHPSRILLRLIVDPIPPRQRVAARVSPEGRTEMCIVNALCCR